MMKTILSAMGFCLHDVEVIEASMTNCQAGEPCLVRISLRYGEHEIVLTRLEDYAKLPLRGTKLVLVCRKGNWDRSIAGEKVSFSGALFGGEWTKTAMRAGLSPICLGEKA